jgi:hypothetical protein
MDLAANARAIIGFGRPERVLTGIPGHQLKYFGCDHESWDGGGHHLPVGSSWTDIWGTRWDREHDGVMGFPRGNPLADLPAALKTYRWPDPDDERLCGPIHRQAAAGRACPGLLGGSHRDTLWERAYMLVGMENLMVFIREEPGAVAELLERIMDFQLGIARHYLAAGIACAHLGDDLGTQRSLLVSPTFLRRTLLPQYRRLTGLYRAHGVLVGFHSCGHILPAVEDFIGMGVDVLNPVQANANDLGACRRYSARLLVFADSASLRSSLCRIRENRLFAQGGQGPPSTPVAYLRQAPSRAAPPHPGAAGPPGRHRQRPGGRRAGRTHPRRGALPALAARPRRRLLLLPRPGHALA